MTQLAELITTAYDEINLALSKMHPVFSTQDGGGYLFRSDISGRLAKLESWIEKDTQQRPFNLWSIRNELYLCDQTKNTLSIDKLDIVIKGLNEISQPIKHFPPLKKFIQTAIQTAIDKLIKAKVLLECQVLEVEAFPVSEPILTNLVYETIAYSAPTDEIKEDQIVFDYRLPKSTEHGHILKDLLFSSVEIAAKVKPYMVIQYKQPAIDLSNNFLTDLEYKGGIDNLARSLAHKNNEENIPGIHFIIYLIPDCIPIAFDLIAPCKEAPLYILQALALRNIIGLTALEAIKFQAPQHLNVVINTFIKSLSEADLYQLYALREDLIKSRFDKKSPYSGFLDPIELSFFRKEPDKKNVLTQFIESIESEIGRRNSILIDSLPPLSLKKVF